MKSKAELGSPEHDFVTDQLPVTTHHKVLICLCFKCLFGDVFKDASVTSLTLGITCSVFEMIVER